MTGQIERTVPAPAGTESTSDAARGLGRAFAVWVAAIVLLLAFGYAAMGEAQSAERIAVLTMSDAISQASGLAGAADPVTTGSVPARTVHGIRALEKHDIAFGGIMLLFFAMSAGLWRLWRSTISRMTYPRGGLRR
ncbi:MAG TPA: hypothetical protein PLG99_02975 [Kaistiaceae bacterium]|nr:hypothetical protein [Kaistiaceae bacterium]